ncbi:hypothetical protein VNO78_15165 [Psophocarpus tetragonolobus]|uniref:Uncharacterized protein n=1 Tax=Psophocarpus tetragonolobus TaxID=3891 RepID=A0AAN9XIY5_PSOTE
MKSYKVAMVDMFLRSSYDMSGMKISMEKSKALISNKFQAKGFIRRVKDLWSTEGWNLSCLFQQLLKHTVHLVKCISPRLVPGIPGQRIWKDNMNDCYTTISSYSYHVENLVRVDGGDLGRDAHGGFIFGFYGYVRDVPLFPFYKLRF